MKRRVLGPNVSRLVGSPPIDILGGWEAYIGPQKNILLKSLDVFLPKESSPESVTFKGICNIYKITRHPETKLSTRQNFAAVNHFTLVFL